MDMTNLPDFALPLLAAVLAGGLIGFEREWRGRAAGFRTHILVCLASALLMELAVSQDAWRFATMPGTEIITDPARMAHGVLTGIGFLCAGVIFREGFSVHGLTTAASLWVTSAIGVLLGVGMWQLALVAAGATLGVLAVLRLADAKLPHIGVMDVVLRWKRGTAPGEARVRNLLKDAGLKAVRLGHVIAHDGKVHEHHMKVKGPMPMDIDGLVARLSDEHDLVGFSVMPRDE